MTFLQEPVFQSRSQVFDTLASRRVLNLLQDRHTSHGRRGVVLTVQLSPVFSFSKVPNNSVGCVGCEGDKVGIELSNEVINVVDLFVIVALFSKDSDPGLQSGLSAKLRRS